MSYKNIGIIILIVIIVCLLGFYVFKKLNTDVYTPTPYEQQVINYFREVTLKVEFGTQVNKVIKWKNPMAIYVVKDKDYQKQIRAIKNTINEFNKLPTDGFKIELTDCEDSSNTILYLCDREMVSLLAPNFYKKFNDDIDIDVSGFAYVDYSLSGYNIWKALIYIDPTDSIDVQISTILEEITQSTGLINDPESHKNSIFYEHKSRDSINIFEYSKLDKDVIKLLYHPKMKAGLNEKKVERVIKRILKNKEIELSGS